MIFSNRDATSRCTATDRLLVIMYVLEQQATDVQVYVTRFYRKIFIMVKEQEIYGIFGHKI